MNTQRFECSNITCPWQGPVPSISDSTPQECRPDESRPRVSVLLVCPRCGSAVFLAREVA